MTTIAVLADPPREGLVLTDFVEQDLLTPAEATDLYAAMLSDVCESIRDSGADLLVNYRPDDQVPGGGSEEAVRDVLADEIDTGDVRFEVQVGSSVSARAGNTVTHLLEREEVKTAAVVRPAAALLGRQHVDSAAMKLRSNDVVLSPSTDGRVAYAGFGDTIDFEDVFAAPTVETLVQRGTDAGLSVDFLPTIPVLESVDDLTTVVPQLRARREAGRLVPTRTAETVDSLGLAVVEEDGEPTVVRRD